LSKKVILLVGSIRKGGELIKELTKGLTNTQDYTVCSSSFFFMHGGVFTFDESKLSEAHEKTRNKFIWAIKTGIPLVIINDTLSTFQQRAFYQRVSLQEGFEVEMRVLVENEKIDIPQGIYKIYLKDGQVEVDILAEQETVSVPESTVSVPESTVSVPESTVSVPESTEVLVATES
jgi:hypothetical protein